MLTEEDMKITDSYLLPPTPKEAAQAVLDKLNQVKRGTGYLTRMLLGSNESVRILNFVLRGSKIPYSRDMIGIHSWNGHRRPIYGDFHVLPEDARRVANRIIQKSKLGALAQLLRRRLEQDRQDRLNNDGH